MQADKLACYSFMWQKNVTLGSETKDFITRKQPAIRRNVHAPQPRPPHSPADDVMWAQVGASSQWAALQERNSELRTLGYLEMGHKYLPITPKGDIIFVIVDSKLACSLPQGETLYLQGYKQT